eukprot:Gregarina_sp_Pseudo_9__1328@NODE_188_length_3731_cov_112_015710_g173_i0_p2_GENE_NODE_188_length_3731_cov_112_015710_g173_i0NODE_188_length_3731_cov_112_015710_g173_i0_p2_ORF_typecomplete_len525_score114_29Integrin_beta/PF00362_18/5_1e18Integrin_beta/PF00362_18/0_5Mucin15/PF15672_5/1_2e05Podoplanin/PF05808_11/7_5e05_NODE_188_length_3731_cov_112_015710_g173_i020363610
MKVSILAAIFTTYGVVGAEQTSCESAVEILVLQDASASFAEHVQRWAATAEDLMALLGSAFPEYKMGLSSFTDKPIPRSGYGRYGGWDEYQQDYCYARHVPLSDDAVSLRSGLQELGRGMGSGADIPEAQAEAMLLAALDEAVGWSPESHTPAGFPIAKVLLLITDAEAHEAGDAAAHLAEFNAPRLYPYGFEFPSEGGFGSHSFGEGQLLATAVDPELRGLYTEMANLFARADAATAGAGPALTEPQVARLEQLISTFGPYPFPDLKYPEHPGDDSELDCTKTEYPSLTQTMLALKRRGILPLILTSTQKAYDFYSWYQENVFQPLGMSTVVSMFDNDSLFADMVDALSLLVTQDCLASTSEPELPGFDSTGAETASDTSDFTDSVGDLSVDATSEAFSPETAETDLETEQESTRVDSSSFEDSTSTEDEVGDFHSSTTEEMQPPVLIVPGAEGEASNKGVIAGASVGAVAGVAAIAAVLYKTVGFSVFSQQDPALVDIAQVEASENPLDREVLEQVSMELFF